MLSIGNDKVPIESNLKVTELKVRAFSIEHASENPRFVLTNGSGF